MRKCAVLILLVLSFAQAQLVPEGMVVPAAEPAAADSVAPTPVVEQPAPVNMVELPEGETQDLNASIVDDSTKYYEVEIFRNNQDYAHRHAISQVLMWVAAGVGVVGFGVTAAGFLMEDEDNGSTCRHVGEGILLGSLVTVGFSFGFDVSADGARIRAQHYSQKLSDYRRRLSDPRNQ
jgi:hypothetical protein